MRILQLWFRKETEEDKEELVILTELILVR